MTKAEILQQVRTYISERVLDGRDIGLDESTPLLELRILNSLELVKLVEFASRQFGVKIPYEDIVAKNFHTLATITNLIDGLRDPGQ